MGILAPSRLLHCAWNICILILQIGRLKRMREPVRASVPSWFLARSSNSPPDVSLKQDTVSDLNFLLAQSSVTAEPFKLVEVIQRLKCPLLFSELSFNSGIHFLFVLYPPIIGRFWLDSLPFTFSHNQVLKYNCNYGHWKYTRRNELCHEKWSCVHLFGYDGENKVKTPVEDNHTTPKKLTEVCILKICN